MYGTNSKGRTIHRGLRGGFYVLEGTKKIYKKGSILPVPAPVHTSMVNTNTKGRKIHKGPRGGMYVIDQKTGKKIYKFKVATTTTRVSPKLRLSPPKKVRVSPLKRLLERVRRRKIVPKVKLSNVERVPLTFKHFDKKGDIKTRKLSIAVQKNIPKNSEMMMVEKDTLPLQSWIDEQAKYLKSLNDYDFYTAMSYTVRSHQWIGPYMRTGNLSSVSFTKPHGFVMPLVYQLVKISKSNPNKTPFEQYLVSLGDDKHEQEMYVRLMSLHIPKNVLKEALDLYIKDLQRIVRRAPPLPRTMVVYRGVKDDIFKGKLGAVHKVDGFASAAYVPQRVYAPSNYLRIKLLKGTRVLLLQCLNDWDHDGEYEVLLNYGSRYIIRKRNLLRPVLNSTRNQPKMKYVTDVTVF